MQPKTKKLLYLVIGLLTALGIALYVQHYIYKTKATENQVNLTLNPKNQAFTTTTGKVMLTIQPQDSTKKINGFTVVLKADSDLKIEGIEDPVGTLNGTVVPNAYQQVKKTLSGDKKTLDVSYIVSNLQMPDAELPNLVTIQVNLTGTSQTGNLSIDPSTQIVGTVTGSLFSFGTVDQGSYSFSATGPTATPGPAGSTINITFNPKTQSFTTSSGKTNLTFKPQDSTKKINGFTVTLKGDANLKIEDIEAPVGTLNGTVVPNAYQQLKKTLSADKKTLDFTYIISNLQMPNAQLPNEVSIPVTVSGNSQTGHLTFDSSSQVTGTVTGTAFSLGNIDQGSFSFSVIGNPTATPTTGIGAPTATPGGGEIGNVALAMKVSFQGILKKPSVSTIPIKVTLTAPGASPVSQSANFTADDKGVWSGSVSFNTAVRSDYTVLIKGPKHLQKKVCESQPKETKKGTYRCSVGKVSLKAGQNSLDFSGITMLTGDLPQQDGVVDSYDISLVRNIISQSAEKRKDPANLATSDINLDGIVDSQDYSLIIASLSIKFDEE